MTYKEFLKLDRRKFLLFLLLWLIPYFFIANGLFLIPIFSTCPPCYYERWLCQTPDYCKAEFWEPLIDPVLGYLFPTKIFIHKEEDCHFPECLAENFQKDIIILITSYLLFYFIICSIVWIYDRVKKK